MTPVSEGPKEGCYSIRRASRAVTCGAVLSICFLGACRPAREDSGRKSEIAEDSQVELPAGVPPLPTSSITYLRQVHERLEVLAQNPDPDAQLGAAELAGQIGDLWRRESLLRGVLKRAPNDQRVRFQLAEALERQLRFREAKALYLELQARNPSRVEPYLGLASASRELEGRPAAWRWLAQGAHACRENTSGLLKLADKYREWDDFPEADRLLSMALQREPQNGRILFQRGALRIQMGKSAEGQAILENLIAREPVNPSAHVALATAMLTGAASAHELARARAHAERAVSQDPRNPDAHWVSGAIYRKLGLVRMAARSYGQALALNPEDPQSRYGLAQIYKELGMDGLAAEQMAAYEEAAARVRSRKLAIARTSEGGGGSAGHLELARIAERSGNFAAAIREAQTAVSRNSSDPNARRYLSHLYSRLGWGAPPEGPPR